MTTYNPYQSLIFQQEQIKQRLPVALTDECFIFLITLYGRQFEAGTVTVQTFKNMSMADIRDELHIRTKIIRADNQRNVQKDTEKINKDQDTAINELLSLQATQQNTTIGN